MPRPPPRPLCLPELVSNPQTRADFVLANPPKYGPSSSRLSSYSDSPYSRAPPSPTSTNDADSHRASGATLASLTCPETPASSRTSLSVHNLPWNGDAPKSPGIDSGVQSMPGNSSEGKSWSFSRLSLAGGAPVGSQKHRTSWSSAIVSTRSWFSSGVTEPAEVSSPPSSQKEIKLSPSMIAASALNQPVSCPYPSASTTRPPRVGTGMRYYTERDPAPAHARIQIPDPIDLQDHDRPQFPRPPSHQDTSVPTSTFSTFGTPAKELPAIPDVTFRVLSPTQHLASLKDVGMLRCENTAPLSPPPTPPVHERESNLPHIRVSFGED